MKGSCDLQDCETKPEWASIVGFDANNGWFWGEIVATRDDNDENLSRPAFYGKQQKLTDEEIKLYELE